MNAEKRHAGETAKIGGARALAGRVNIATAAKRAGSDADGIKPVRSLVVIGEHGTRLLDACARAMGLRSRSKALAAIVADMTRAPIAADVSPDAIGAEPFIDYERNGRRVTIHAQGFIGGAGYGKFMLATSEHGGDADETAESMIARFLVKISK